MPRTTRRLTIQTALTVPPARLTLNNREYLTAPAVLIVEGVLNGAYIPGSELVAHDWNNVPIVLNHPLDAQGVPMSARTPEVLAAMEAQETRKAVVIAALVANTWCRLSESTLKSMSLQELEDLTAMGEQQSASYAGLGLPVLRQHDGAEESWQPKSILAKKE